MDYLLFLQKERGFGVEKAVSIGTQDFEVLRKNNYFYVDKTDFIREWWGNGDAVTLITRPRRFGKTLNLNMLRCFFSNEYVGRSDLFQGLSIWEREEYRALQGSYPVIYLSFALIKGATFQITRGIIVQLIVSLYDKYQFLKEDGFLSENERRFFDSVNAEMGDDTVSLALNQLSLYLSRYYGKKVLILLDEYDTPLQEAYIRGYWNELTIFMRSLFNAAFKTNDYMERALLTGITRVSKESIFSDLNNLEVVTTTSEKYAFAFGFTEEEVFSALEQRGLSAEKEEVKFWYDGFTFGKRSDIYNPWSITKFLDTKEYGTYWADTSENSMVSDLVKKGTPQLKMGMEDLLAGNILRVELDEQVVFEQLHRKRGAVWSLLLASGYLKAVQKEFDRAERKFYYHLKITNYETMRMFEVMIENWFSDEDTAYGNFKEALIAGDLDYMNQYMNKIALQSFSSFDTGIRTSEQAEPERFYHGFVLGLIVDLAKKYRIQSNRESGFGRYDVMMEPLQENLPGIILEFKVFHPGKEKNLEETVQNAKEQIKVKGYDTELLARGISIERIRHYGFAFEGKRVLIG